MFLSYALFGETVAGGGDTQLDTLLSMLTDLVGCFTFLYFVSWRVMDFNPMVARFPASVVMVLEDTEVFFLGGVVLFVFPPIIEFFTYVIFRLSFLSVLGLMANTVNMAMGYNFKNICRYFGYYLKLDYT